MTRRTELDTASRLIGIVMLVASGFPSRLRWQNPASVLCQMHSSSLGWAKPLNSMTGIRSGFLSARRRSAILRKPLWGEHAGVINFWFAKIRDGAGGGTGHLERSALGNDWQSVIPVANDQDRAFWTKQSWRIVYSPFLSGPLAVNRAL